VHAFVTGAGGSRKTAWLGLLALVLQLVLTCGHFHADALRGFASAGEAHVGSDAPGPDAPDREPGLPHPDCPTCLTLHSVGSALVPVFPALDAPALFATTEPCGAIELTLSPPPFSLFRTRAPPIA
jgi:hypothetical protein